MFPFPPPCFFWHLEKREALGRADVWGIPQWKACFAMETFAFISKPQSLMIRTSPARRPLHPSCGTRPSLDAWGRFCLFLGPLLGLTPHVCLLAPSHTFSLLLSLLFPCWALGSLFPFCHILTDLLSYSTVKGDTPSHWRAGIWLQPDKIPGELGV